MVKNAFRKILLFLIFQFGLYFSQAQDTTNIIDLSDHFQVHFLGKQKYTRVLFRDDDFKTNLNYSPNEQLNVGFGFNYRFLGIGIAFNFKFINNDDLVYGDTKRIDWQINGYGKRSVIDLTFFYYQSYYLTNPSEIFQNWQVGDANYIRPDMKMSSIGLSYLYVFNNKKFSYKAAFISTAIQKKSAGSFLFGGQFHFLDLRSDSSFFPANSTFSRYNAIDKLNRNNMGLSFGYAYNLIVSHHFYISGGVSASPGIGLLNYRFKHNWPSIFIVPSISLTPRAAVGYNGLHYYFGISSSTQITFLELNSHNLPDLSWQNGNFRFFIGKRFLK